MNVMISEKEILEELLDPCSNWSMGSDGGITGSWTVDVINSLIIDEERFEKYLRKKEELLKYANNHVSKIKKVFIDQIKQSPQDWEIRENKKNSGNLIVTNNTPYKGRHGAKAHHESGFTKEEWAEIRNAVKKSDSFDKNLIIREIEKLCDSLCQINKNRAKKEKDFFNGRECYRKGANDGIKELYGEEGYKYYQDYIRKKANQKEWQENEKFLVDSKEQWLKERSEVYKKIKNLILKDLTLWELGLEGNIFPIERILANLGGAGEGYSRYGSCSEWKFIEFDELNENGHREIIRAFVEEIKQNPRDWKIESEGELTVIKHKSGRKHRKSNLPKGSKKGFSSEELAEIEQAIKNSQGTQSPLDKNKKSWNPEKVKSQPLNEKELNDLNYQEIVVEIEKIKAEIKLLEKNGDNNSSEKKSQLQTKLEKMEEIKGKFINSKNPDKSGNDFPTGWVIGGVIVAVIGLTTLFIVKNNKKKIINN